MLLTFNVLYDKLMDQTKLQTARLNWERWIDWAQGAFACDTVKWEGGRGTIIVDSDDRLLQIYWRSPRNNGTKLGDGLLRRVVVKPRIRLNQEDAVADGFDTTEEFIKAVMARNPKEYVQPSTLVALLTFEWTDGPHDVVCHDCLKAPSRSGARTTCAECFTKGVL